MLLEIEMFTENKNFGRKFYISCQKFYFDEKYFDFGIISTLAKIYILTKV